MVGARSIALPRLLAYSYWMFLFGGIFLYVMFLGNVGPDNGWFSYPPLAGPEFGYGKRADVWAQLITFTEVSSLVGRGLPDLHHPQASHARACRSTACRSSSGRCWSSVVHGHLRHAGGHALEHLPDPRPAGRHAFLQPGRGRRPAALAAPLLVLRPPRGLHHLPAGARDDVGDHRHLLAAAGLRLPR